MKCLAPPDTSDDLPIWAHIIFPSQQSITAKEQLVTPFRMGKWIPVSPHSCCLPNLGSILVCNLCSRDKRQKPHLGINI